MKLIWDILLLIGMLPGTVLPSYLTEQLIAPALFKVDSADDSPDNQPVDDEKSPADSGAKLKASSVYSATRPAAFPYSKGDLRNKRSESTCFLSSRDLVARDTGRWPNSGPARFVHDELPLALDHATTSPAIQPQAPPRAI